MADYPKQFEEWWAKADDEMKKGMACVGFCNCMRLFSVGFSVLTQINKKEEP